jgi:hypothetical protein
MAFLFSLVAGVKTSSGNLGKVFDCRLNGKRPLSQTCCSAVLGDTSFTETLSRSSLQTEGVFRIAAESAEEEYIRSMLNKGEEPPNTEVHVLAGLIKVNKQSFLMKRCFAL